MEIVAHHRSPRPADRGAVTAALRAQLASGADRIELDVLAYEGATIVAHDARGVRGAPTLPMEEALALIASVAGVQLLADLKHPAAAPDLGGLLVASGLRARTMVCGELDAVLEACHLGGASAAWTVPARRGGGPPAGPGPWGLATPRARGRLRRAAAWAVREGGCAALSVAHPFVDRALLEAVHAAGGRVFAWTVDDPGEQARLARLGVDGLITNEPAAALAVRASLPGHRPTAGA